MLTPPDPTPSHPHRAQPPADGSRPPPPPADGDPHFAMLSEWAPRLLRALYDRDVRRPYCQPLLWLAPYVEMFGSEDAVPRECLPCWVVVASDGAVCEALSCGCRGEHTVDNSV